VSDTDSMKQALEILKDHLGYLSFRKGQEQVIRAIFAGKDVPAVMPTGAVKSLCYQILACMFPGLSLVVSRFCP
jgi:ATP-dependent DNA helicase RecQ